MTFNERQRRLSIACKAVVADGFAIEPLCKFLNVSTKTVCKGICELREKTSPGEGRIRRPGGGAKDKIAQHPEWKECFLVIVSDHMAGDPMNEDIVWLNINAPGIRREFLKRGMDISAYHVRRLINECSFKSSSFRKDISMHKVEGRNEQFERISMVKRMCV